MLHATHPPSTFTGAAVEKPVRVAGWAAGAGADVAEGATMLNLRGPAAAPVVEVAMEVVAAAVAVGPEGVRPAEKRAPAAEGAAAADAAVDAGAAAGGAAEKPPRTDADAAIGAVVEAAPETVGAAEAAAGCWVRHRCDTDVVVVGVEVSGAVAAAG